MLEVQQARQEILRVFIFNEPAPGLVLNKEMPFAIVAIHGLWL
jgi:hypothetical protein